MDWTTRAARRGAVVCSVILLVTTLVGGSVAAGAVAEYSQSTPQQEGPQPPTAQEAFDADDVRLTVEVGADGTASWTVEYWKRLDDDESEQAFSSVESDVEANPGEYVDGFAESMDGTVASAAEDTDREMSASGYAVSTRTESIPQEYGVLTYRFEWSGFAAVDGDRLAIGDAISGFYLDDQTRLVVGWPGEFDLVDVRPEPAETRTDSVLWRGSQTAFVGDEPRIVVSTEPDDADGIGGDTGSGAETGVPLLPLGGVVVAVILVVLWWRYSDRRGKDAEGENGEAATGSAVTSTGSTDEPANSGEPEATADAEPPSELLSNEERVVRLLEQHGGRLKQQQVVRKLDWTDAKTSQVIGDLREEGTIETFRIGRENVVRLPEEDDEDLI